MQPGGEKARAAAKRGCNARIQCAGGWNSRFLIIADYYPHLNNKKAKIKSNHPGYGKTWATKEEVTSTDIDDFLAWINEGLARGGGSTRRPDPYLPSAQPLTIRSSARMDARMQQHIPVSTTVAGIKVEAGVLQCVKFLIDNVIHRARFAEIESSLCKRTVHFVQGKRKKTSAPAQTISRHGSRFITGRMRAPRLTSRKSKGFVYRQAALNRRKAAKAEDDLAWLQQHKRRLATTLARQDLHSLLPDGECSDRTRDAPPPSHCSCMLTSYPHPCVPQVITQMRNCCVRIAKRWCCTNTMSCLPMQLKPTSRAASCFVSHR